MQHTPQAITSNDGTRLHMQTWLPDDKPPRALIAVLPGWSDHSDRYMNLVNHAVPLGYGVSALDFRGHGKADGQRGHINDWADYRNDTDAFVRALARQQPGVPLFVLGHSMGGLMGMDYMIHHPQAPLHGLIASAPLLAPPNVSPVLVKLGALVSRVMPRFSLNPGVDPTVVSRDPDVVARYKNDPLGHQRVSARASTEMETTRLFVLDNLDAIKAPFLLIFGGADPLVPPDVSRSVLPKIGSRDKTAYEYANNYHEPMNDLDKERVLSDITNWVGARLGVTRP